MAVKKLSDFKSRLLGGGARPNLFNVRIPDLPFATNWNATTQENFEFLCKASNLPAQNIASIDVPFRGRQFKVAGDRTIDNWTVTVINDENFAIRRAMEKWSEGILNLNNNTGVTDPNVYMKQGFVQQLGRGSKSPAKGVTTDAEDRKILAEYQFQDIWPVTVGDIALSYESGDTIEEFDVEFAVQSIIIKYEAGAITPPRG